MDICGCLRQRSLRPIRQTFRRFFEMGVLANLDEESLSHEKVFSSYPLDISSD